jgi:5-methylcytosine-specific restriction protein A
MQRIVYFNGGWMSKYDGIEAEKIVNGGLYVNEHGFGGEAYNFRNSNGMNYGYVETNNHKINLSRIDFGHICNSDYIDDVICVFVATHPSGGRQIVGWYKNTRVYSQKQDYSGNDRKAKVSCGYWDADQVQYYAMTKNEDAVLLSEKERKNSPEFPHGKGRFGQSNVWHADTEIGYAFREKTLQFISELEKRLYSK